MNEVAKDRTASTEIAKIVYVLYLVGLVAGVTIIVGVVMAYIYKDEAPEWLRTHYELQIRTFWIGLLYLLIAGVLCLILVGFVLLFALAIWWIARAVKGLKYLDRGAAYPGPRSWVL